MFEDKVVYQIYPKSFLDTTGSGTGDLKGIISKLDYLANLGVDYIWLTPIFPSPQNDNGYDVSDYCDIDKRYGTMQEFENLVSAGNKLGIGIMLDMVFNHTSTQHKWFQAAINGDKYYQDFYIFRSKPTNWQSKFGGPAWEYIENLDKYYLHLFDVSQADLNWDNKNVREELKKVILFWKKRGVKGFRFDVINLISKPQHFEDDLTGDGRKFYTDGAKVHEYIKELVSDTQIGNMITVGEMSSTSLDNCIKYSGENTNELSMCFNFHHLKIDYKDGDKWQLANPNFNELKRLFEYWQYGMQKGHAKQALFSGNHDQPRIVSRWGSENKYWAESAKALATCFLLMNGIPYIYQGEEIGMQNADFKRIEQYKDVESLNYYKILRDKMDKQEALDILHARSRDNSRTPMQWNNDKNAGFSKGKPWIKVNDNYIRINAENQLNDDNSILNYYKKLIQLRKNNLALTKGSIQFIETGFDYVIAYVREYERKRILVMCNLSDSEIEINFEHDKVDWTWLMGNYDSKLFTEKLLLKPFECNIWLA